MTAADQLSLLDTGVSAPVGAVPHLPARARRDDPPTSHAAARSMKPDVLSKQRTAVLNVVKAYPHGATAYDVHGSLGIQQSVAARRLTDLHELGLIFDTGRTRPGSTNRELIVWEPTDG